MRIYTKGGDDGTTGRFLGGRVSKADPIIAACGDLDETVACLGIARASAPPHLAAAILDRQRELFVVAADLATNPDHRDRLEAGVSLVSPEMALHLEHLIDELVASRPLRPVFLVPGADPVSAQLDQARAVLRRAERAAVAAQEAGHVVTAELLAYLNRLSDLLYVMARSAAGEEEPPSHE